MPFSRQESTALHLTIKQLQDPTVAPLNRILDFLTGQVPSLSTDVRTLKLNSSGPDDVVWGTSGAHRDRSSANAGGFPLGSFFYENDRTVLYQSQLVQGNPAWVYVAGEMEGTLSPDEKPPDLGLNDVGFLFGSSDYLHRYRWNGNSWHFAAGDAGSAYIVISPDGNEPNGGLWAPCGGGSYSVAQDNGSLATVSTPNYLNIGFDPPFITGGSAPSGIKAATRLLWDTGAKTGNENHTHTHDISVASSINLYSSGTVSGAIAGTYTSTIESDAHQHTLTNTDAVLKAPSEDGTHGGLPARIQAVFFMRR